MGKDKKKQMIRLCVSFSILAIILIVVMSIMIRYEVEGDKNMPFTLSKIIVVSKAGGESVEGKSKWNYDNIYQYNDVYFYIDKNEEYSDKNYIIKNIKIENINVIEAPQMGEVKAYMPDSTKEESFKYTDEYIINDSLTYKGAAKSSSQTLEVGNQGGKVLVSFVNTNIKKYSSNETQINYDTLLKKAGVSSEQIQFKVSFDFTIELSNSSYKANIVLDLPQGDVIKNGTGNLEKTDMSDVVFKRIK